MSFTIALNFEDGVSRFIDCNEGETVLDAAYRNKVNLPMDCSDGVCGTCKCHCDQGEFELGDEYIDEALSDEELHEGQVLTCQMVPSSDCVLSVPVASTSCARTGFAAKAANASVLAPRKRAAVDRIVMERGVLLERARNRSGIWRWVAGCAVNRP